MNIQDIVDLQTHRLEDQGWRVAKRDELRAKGAVPLKGFLNEWALEILQEQAANDLGQAYFNPQRHNIYLTPKDEAFADNHIRNHLVESSKGCITDDQIEAKSPLKTLYHHPLFQSALCTILEEDGLFAYADSLSSVNIHYARKGEELGWHFDNSSFAVTLMIRPAEMGGTFEYVKDVRDADIGEMGFEKAEQIIKGAYPVEQMSMQAGDLLLFRGRNSLHRVTPVADDSVRQLAVLAYNNSPGISLSENAQMTFYGRIGRLNS